MHAAAQRAEPVRGRDGVGVAARQRVAGGGGRAGRQRRRAGRAAARRRRRAALPHVPPRLLRPLHRPLPLHDSPRRHQVLRGVLQLRVRLAVRRRLQDRRILLRLLRPAVRLHADDCHAGTVVRDHVRDLFGPTYHFGCGG